MSYFMVGSEFRRVGAQIAVGRHDCIELECAALDSCKVSLMIIYDAFFSQRFGLPSSAPLRAFFNVSLACRCIYGGNLWHTSQLKALNPKTMLNSCRCLEVGKASFHPPPSFARDLAGRQFEEPPENWPHHPHMLNAASSTQDIGLRAPSFWRLQASVSGGNQAPPAAPQHPNCYGLRLHRNLSS